MTPAEKAMQIFLDVKSIDDFPPSQNMSFDAMKRAAYVAAEHCLQECTLLRIFYRKRLKFWEEVKIEIRKIRL